MAYEPLPQVKEGYNRYFFLAPDDWFNEQTDSIGIYWWDGTDSQTAFPGIKANKADAENVYYYDVPEDVTAIIWDNYIEVPDPIDLPMHRFARRTALIHTQDNMGKISVIRPNWQDTANFDEWYPPCDWYYYYGEGKYGTTPEEFKDHECNRYYFLMPDEWYNEYTDAAGIYWWEGTNAQTAWPGVKANKADAENVYYYDVPKDVTTIIWNNYLDLLMEDKESVMHLDFQTVNITMSSPDEYDGKIYVINPELTTENPFDNKKVYEGDWYKYLGNGEYESTDILGDANEDNELNIKDATVIQKHLANIFTLSERGIRLADYNKSGDIDIKDATAIQKYLAGIPE
ncbi:MAG: dockerin type I repeat-containing protein [Ruminococcus sp.]